MLVGKSQTRYLTISNKVHQKEKFFLALGSLLNLLFDGVVTVHLKVIQNIRPLNGLTFFTQVFEHNFFHADMHPGNIFVDIEDPDDPSYIAIDCAIIGQLSREDQDYLAKNLLAFFNRDYGQVARLHLESGWIPEGTDPDAFERVIQEVCEPIFAKPLNEISFGHFLVQLFQAAREFNMEVQPQLVLLQKTLLYIEGLGREIATPEEARDMLSLKGGDRVNF